MKVIVHHWQTGLTRANFGEAIVPLLVRHLGCEYLPNIRLHSTLPHKRLLMIGSELNEDFLPRVHPDRSKITVWGYGYSHGTPPKPGTLDVRAVRGHITREALKLPQSTPMCDPGFLLPAAFPKPDLPTSKWPLYAPHWNNRRHGAEKAWQADFFNVEIRRSSDYLQQAITRLITAPFVYTNSLHIVIACLAYRVPFAPCLGPGDKSNKSLKWRDVWSTLEGDEKDVRWCHDVSSAHAWWDRVGQYLRPPDSSRLIDVFPRDIGF